jgi:CRP/FNR family transcriptional regulator, cyclic AMP receptor protein
MFMAKAGPPSPFNLQVIESCYDCANRESGLVCKLPQSAVRELNTIRQSAFYPRGVVLYAEGETPRGIYILCSGEVRLTARYENGNEVILHLATRGDILGLSNAISREPHRVRAETLSACQIGFISRLPFLQFLRAHPDAALRIAEHLSTELHKAWEQVQLVTLASSSNARLVRFLLAWAATHGQEFAEGASLALFMTHEEIAQSIGVSRETVSRALAALREEKLITFSRGHIVLLHPEKLKSLADS